MSLYVNTAPGWTYGSRYSFGCRGYLRRPYSRLSSPQKSFNCVGSRSPRCTSPYRLHQFPLRRAQSLSSPYRPINSTYHHGTVDQSTNNHKATSLTTAGSKDDSFTDTSIQGSEDTDRISSISFTSSRTQVTTTEESPPVALNKELMNGIPEQPSLHNHLAFLTIRSSSPPIVSSPSNAASTARGPAHVRKRIKKHQSPDSQSRELANLFKAQAMQIKMLLSEGKSLEYIRACYDETIRASNTLLELDNHQLDQWLNEPQDYDMSLKLFRIAQLFVGSILTSPQQTIRILRLLNETESDFSIRSKCLSMLGHVHKETLLKDAVLMAKFDAQVKTLMAPHRWPARGMNSRDLSLLLWCTGKEDAQNLITSFLAKYPSPSLSTSLYLAMHCSQNGMDALALSILVRLPSEELQSPGPVTLKCCQVLLRNDVVESTSDGPNFKFLPRLLERGLKPDNILYSRIIEKALDSGYAGVAWDIFHHLQATKIEMTGWTYLLLLRHSFNENNIPGVQEIMSEIQQNEALYSNVHLLMYSMNVVRRIFYNEKNMTTSESLSHILALYDRVFSRDTLTRLEILPVLPMVSSQPPPPVGEVERELMEPDAYSLAFTIWAYILCHRRGKSTQRLWARIQRLVDAGDASILACMKHDLIYNALIWLNVKDKGGMASALEILQYMLARQFCLPTDRTWSILICGFLRQDQKVQAKHIYALMKQCNLKMTDIRQEYWRRQWTFEYFEKHLEEILDEQMMPDGTDLGVAQAMKSS